MRIKEISSWVKGKVTWVCWVAGEGTVSVGDEGYFIGYSMSSKAFRVFNKRTKRVEENLHVDFLENKPIEKGTGPNWLFDIDSLTNSMNYVPEVIAGINSTNILGTKEAAGQDVKKDVYSLRYIVLPNWFHESHLESSTSNAQDTCSAEALKSSGISNPTATSTNPPADHMETLAVETLIPTISSLVPTACLNDSLEPSSDTRLISKRVTSQDDTPSLDNKLTLTNRFEDILGVTTNTDDLNGISDAPQDPSWVEAMQEELLQFKIQNVWSLVDCPKGEEGIEYDEVFAHVARIEVIKLFLAYASFMGFTVYQMDVKKFPARVYKVEKAMYGLHQAHRAWYGTLSKYLLTNGFQRGAIDQTMFIKRHREDFILVQVYVDDIIFGSSNLQLCREFEALMHEKFQMSAMGDILKKFGYSNVISANTPMDKENPWGKDRTGKDVDLHHYRSMIGSLMYLTASRPDIMFAICACARHQVTPKECHLYAVKRIFRYLKGHPKLGLWYPKESPFDLVAYLDRDYGGASQDCKSTTGGSQFLGRRLISWQCKKQTIMATSTTKAEYVAAASCCGQVPWIQNQLLDYGRNLKLNDEAGISSLPDAELFENLQLMGYNILPNQKFTFQKGQFSHQWKYLIHTIMQCLSLKSIGFNEFSSNIATALVCLATNRVYNFSKMIFDGMGEGSGTPTESHHTPTSKASHSSHLELPSPSLLLVPTESLPTVIPSDNPPLRQYTRRARIAQSLALPPVADEPASPIANDKMVSKFEAQELEIDPYICNISEINSLKARIKLLEDKDRGVVDQSRDDAPIKGRRLDKGEEAAKRVSDDIEEMATVLTSMDAASIQTSGGVQVVPTAAEVATATVSIPTGSGVVYTASPTIPTSSPIFTTATDFTPYTRRKEKEKMVESDTPKKKKLQEQIYVQKFDPVWKQFQDFIPLGSKEEAERFKRKGLRLEQESVKKLKTSEEVKATEEVPEEKVKEMMQLVPVEEIYVEAFQVKHPIINWKVHTEGQGSYWKIIRLGGSSASYQFFVDMLKHFDREDLNQLWELVKETLSIRPATSDKEMEIWVELKRLDEFPLPEQLPTANEDKFPLLIQSDATAVKLALLLKSRNNVNIPRCDEDRLELLELKLFLLPSDEKVGVEFWTTVAVKKVNDVTRLQALVDKKKVIITEATIRDALPLDDAEGIKCLPNEEIFAELARMGKQVGDLSSHYTKYISPALTQKVFANIRRVGKGFYGVDTPLFKGMLVVQEVGEDANEVHAEDVNATGVVAEGATSDDVNAAVEEPSIPPPTPPTLPPQPSQDIPSTSQDKIAQALETTKLKLRVKKLERRNKASKLKRLKKVGTTQRFDTSDDTVMDDVSKQRGIIANIDADEDVVLEDAKDVAADAKDGQDADIGENEEESEPTELQEVVDVVTTTKIITEVVTAASTTLTAATPQLTTAAAPTLIDAPSRRRKGTKAQARKNMMIYHRNVAGFKMDYYKGITYDDKHPVFEKHFDSNVDFLQKTKEQMDEKDSRAHKRLDESQEDKAAKKQKLDEEVEELKRHLQVVPNDEDDVYTEATPLALKVPIVDYEIYNEKNKPYYKIKRANDSHQLYLSFLSLLRNFDREDLEALWRLVKEIFATIKPKNFFDDFLLITLGAMFEKPDIHAQI
nr:hypothetical protein [Tanacetum cinerariifolium]